MLQDDNILKQLETYNNDALDVYTADGFVFRCTCDPLKVLFYFPFSLGAVEH